MANDISRNTIFVLVILTLIVSVLGMWTILSQVSGVTSVAPAQETDSGSGTVSLKIQPPGSTPTDLASGKVVLKIEPPMEDR